jgi:hypothetical protein
MQYQQLQVVVGDRVVVEPILAQNVVEHVLLMGVCVVHIQIYMVILI